MMVPRCSSHFVCGVTNDSPPLPSKRWLGVGFRSFDFCIPTRDTPDWLHEIKYDGYRLRLERDGDRVLQPFGARTPIGRVVTYRLKTATTKTAINTTTPAAMIASSTFGIFNASFDLIQARPALQQGA